jgi:hypothetical protein
MTWAKLMVFCTFECTNQKLDRWLQGILTEPHKAICRPISHKLAASVCENLYFHQIQSLATPFHRSEFITARPTSQLGSSVLALKLFTWQHLPCLAVQFRPAGSISVRVSLENLSIFTDLSVSNPTILSEVHAEIS